VFQLKNTILGLFNERDAGLYPTGFAVGVVIESIGVLIYSVAASRVELLLLAPRPCPRQVGHAVLLLHLVGNVDPVQGVKCIHVLHSFFCSSPLIGSFLRKIQKKIKRNQKFHPTAESLFVLGFFSFLFVRV
jgi:hypothetical protein